MRNQPDACHQPSARKRRLPGALALFGSLCRRFRPLAATVMTRLYHKGSTSATGEIPSQEAYDRMLHHLLQQALAIDPDRPIIEADGSWTTAGEVERLASRLASGLAAIGLEEGDRVALLLPNCLETIVCHLALLPDAFGRRPYRLRVPPAAGRLRSWP
ncbi:MAG: AMP-binding protein [Planctomycetaceae bacterium]